MGWDVQSGTLPVELRLLNPVPTLDAVSDSRSNRCCVTGLSDSQKRAVDEVLVVDQQTVAPRTAGVKFTATYSYKEP